MKKNTIRKLSEKLVQYSALTAAIAGISEINGQVIHVEIDPDFVGGMPLSNFIFDFDGDGTEDFEIYSNGNGALCSLNGSNRVLGSGYISSSSSFGNVYPFALSYNAVISGGQAEWYYNRNNFSNGFNVLNVWSCQIPSRHKWCDVTNKFLGIEFKIGSNTHYAWIRLDVDFSGTGWIIKDYAYNSTAGASVLAGEGIPTARTEDNIFNRVKVVALNKSIGLYNLQDISRYSIMNMTGQEVLNGLTQNKDYVIEVPTLASGVYIFELKDINSDAIMRKKVVLQ